MNKEDKEIEKLVLNMFNGDIGAIQFNNSQLFVQAVQKVIINTKINSWNSALKKIKKKLIEEVIWTNEIEDIIEGLLK